MKAFISYAHDDIRQVNRLREKLAATGEDFDIAFWGDEKLQTGYHWNLSIQAAIEEADLFVLAVSDAYRNSLYIRDKEMPAINRRARAVKGLICPVILKPCSWERFVGELQGVPMKNRRLVPITLWPQQDLGYDEVRKQLETAIRAHFKLIPKVRGAWYSPLEGLREEQPGPIWTEIEDQFGLDPAGGDTDIAAATDRATQQLHGRIREKAKAFATKIDRLDNSLRGEWDGFIAAAQNLAQVLDRPTDEIPDCVALAWEASVRLASFLAMDKRLAANPQLDQDMLALDIHRDLDDLIGSVAPWVRRFPTARDLDNERGAYLTNPALFADVATVTQAAEKTTLITTSAADSMRASIETAARDEVQGSKAGTYAVRGARGLMSRCGSYMGVILVGAVSSAYATHSPLVDKIGRFMATADSSIASLISDFPADIKHAMDRLLNSAVKREFPFNDTVFVVDETAPPTPKPFPWAHRRGADEYGKWVSFAVPAADGALVEQRMRWIEPTPPEGFLMGSPPTEPGHYRDEAPQHPVRIVHGFWMFDTACTEALWTAVLGRPCKPARGPGFPATGISWTEAHDFIAKLNESMPGLNLVLPSEACWEYACRAGTTTAYNFSEAIDPARVRFASDAPVPAGTLPPNGWGLHEMHGNVWEWCEDHWHDNYDGAPKDGAPWRDAEAIGSADRVLRGGSWGLGALVARSACRLGRVPSFRDDYVGFRCARVQL